MAVKELGYVELEWTCPRCQTRNPGTQTTCSSCGAPQPQDVHFETPVGGTLLTDEEKIARAESGPDIQCGFCGTRNLATAATCRQCGADLRAGKARAAGQVVGAFQSGPAPDLVCTSCGTANPATTRQCSNCGAPLRRPTPLAGDVAPPAIRAGFGWLPLAAIGVIGALIVLFLVLSARTTAVVGTVREAQWVRRVPIEGLVPVQYSGWWDELPQHAAVQSCRAEVRRVQDQPTDNAREVCGTPYTIDTGTGVGRVVQECRYEVLEDRCTYAVDEWRVIDVLEARGNNFAPEWPVTALQPRQRLGFGSEAFTCVLAADDRWYTIEPRTLADYTAQCQPGSQWQLEVNTFGAINSIQPAP